jgi:hypothetical protein
MSSLLHSVTQCMSAVTPSVGSAVNSSHVHEHASSTAPWIETTYSSTGVRGVGPAQRTASARS